MKNIVWTGTWVFVLSFFAWVVFADAAELRGGLSNCSVVVGDLEVGVTTTYTMTFTPDETLDPNALVSDQMSVVTTSGGPDFSSAQLVSVSGGTISAATLGSVNATSANVVINTGEATSADTVTFVLSNVINPGTVGQGPNYSIRGVDFEGFPNPNPAPTASICVVSGSVYTPSTDPVVVNPIEDQVLEQIDGAQIIVQDLDTVFEDADGVLTFAVTGNTDANVATASIDVNDTLTVTPQGSGTTTFTIEASSGGASITNAFDVRVIGQLSNVTVTPQNLDAGATTSYAISFSPSNLFGAGYSLGINSGVTGPDYTNAVLQSITGGSGLAATINASPTNQGIGLNISAGTASSADTVTIQLDNIVNPGAAGQGPDYTFIVINTIPSTVVADRATISGNVYDAVGGPTVLQQIPTQNLDEANGPGVVVADLNTIFIDGDGDPLTFTVEAGNDANVATASINGDELTVTPTGPGSTSITVKASDLPAGGEGEVTTSFDVNVVGLMDNASWMPITLDTENITIYTFTFDPSSTLEIGQRIIIDNAAAGGPDYTNAALNFIQGGTLTAVIESVDVDTIVAEITGGTAGVGDTVTLEFSNIVNPAVGGQGPDYQLRLLRLQPIGDVERITVAGTVFNDVGMPRVTTPIDDQVLNEADGTAEIIADLNTVFMDGNGQTLVFTVEPGNDPMIATASISNNALTVTPLSSGTTTITVQASDLAAGGTGTVTDSFAVRVVGQLDNVNVIPASPGISTDTVYQLAFTPAGVINADDVIRVSTTAGGPDFSAASLENFSGGSLFGTLMAQSPTSISIEIIAGMATSANTVSFEFEPVTNPAIEGIGPGYLIEILDAGEVQDFASAPGTDYIDTDLIFGDGFDVAATRDQLAKAIVADVPYFGEAATQRPFYDDQSQHYLFVGAYLSRDLDSGEMRTQAEVMSWLRSVLDSVAPQGDWDADGLLNADDDRPFGIR